MVLRGFCLQAPSLVYKAVDFKLLQFRARRQVIPYERAVFTHAAALGTIAHAQINSLSSAPLAREFSKVALY